MKHQLHIEISKHKETQKNLQETIEKLKSLECLLDNREKRLYYNGQLPIYTKEKNLGSHSLTNLKDVRYKSHIYRTFSPDNIQNFLHILYFSISNAVKASSKGKRNENNMPKDNLVSI